MAGQHTDSEVTMEAVGRRLSCDGELATVRYIGPVPPTTGLWLGVEWDNPDRGKHNGSHEGVQYFTCRHPTGGSFVRPTKVSFGVDYLTALQQVYHNDMEMVKSEEIFIGKRKLKWRPCTKTRSFESLSSVLLDFCEVNGPGVDGDIKTTTPNVKWLDLSGSLLSNWVDVTDFAKQMDQLEGLQLSHNRLSLPLNPSAYSQHFCSLKHLILNKCALTWSQVLECAPMWPNLEELFLEGNHITELQRPVQVLQSLRILSLASNPLVQDSVNSLADLPRLELLNLSDTGLSVIRFEDADSGSKTVMFPALKKLVIDDNNITEWFVIDELAKLPSLIQLSCRRNQLMSSDKNPETAEQMLIAKLGQLEVLNSSKINPSDRRGAELDYLKMFGEKWLKSRGASQLNTQFFHQHPRYQALIEKYGAPEEGELKKRESPMLKNKLIRITFVFPDDPDRKPIEKKLPELMLVQKVKGLLYRPIKVPAPDISLTYTSPKTVGAEFEIHNDLQTLQFYSIKDGDQVLVRWSRVRNEAE
ncbi:tubulin-specific chaperone E [Gouania willdenowi]|uniref:Tubulin-specific chaperone E n=1 Tax=Gouania willdenowi TaxID=441366 RepID=A0A8C5HPL1_GOUWI|nr:tubulin-specific chaperone E [Gouania willdenowi]XP_028312428.1 tubulin-specific chaperone E [Gouania willdenowi]